MVRTNLEQLREQLREARAKKALEDHATSRSNEEKAIKKELFLLKHRKTVGVAKKVKGNLVHMGKNALFYGKTAVTKLQEAEKKNKKKKKKNNSAFGGFDFPNY